MTTSASEVEIVDVGPRVVFRSAAVPPPTSATISIISALYIAGLRRMETYSFINTSELPQFADARDIVTATAALPGLDAQILVAAVVRAEEAFVAGARHLSAIISVSERHSIINSRRSLQESADDFARIVAMLPPNARMRLNIATAFDCPYDGVVAREAALSLLEKLVATTSDVEIAFCDTTGRADPVQIRKLFNSARGYFPEVRKWAFRGHDAYGLGATNILAAWHAGVRVFDAAIARLGACPFSPGATGNVATEDLVGVFDKMGVTSYIDLEVLIGVARKVAELTEPRIGEI